MPILTLEAKLERAGTSAPWGFRMHGGKDFNSPLTIQKVNPGSLADKCGLRVGDSIIKIGNVNSTGLTHKEAQDSIILAGDKLDLLLLRKDGVPANPDDDIIKSSPQFNNYKSIPKVAPTGSSQPYSSSNFNVSAKPYGVPNVPSYGGSNVDNITNRTQNITIQPDYKASAQKYNDYYDPAPSSQPQSRSLKILQGMMDSGQVDSEPIPPWRSEPEYQPTAQKYTDYNEPTRHTQPQSRSLRYLQDMMDSGIEPPNPFQQNQAPPPPPPPANDPKYISKPVGPGDKPGTVKYIVSPKYNTPIGLYSATNVEKTFKGQSKFLVSPDEG